MTRTGNTVAVVGLGATGAPMASNLIGVEMEERND